VVARSYTLIPQGFQETKKKDKYMAKNMTRKGLAFGAAAALAVTGLSVPANALGLADNSFVSLTPPSGTSYAVFAEDGNTFTLTANEASTVQGGNLKFLVEDGGALLEPAAASAGRTALTVDQTSGSNVSAVASTDVVTVVQDGSALAVGDVIVFSHAIIATTGTTTLQAASAPVSVTAVTGTTSFAFKASADVALDVNAVVALGTDSAVKVVREARNSTSNHFVVDTGTNSSSTTSTLVLEDSTSNTKSVNVTAWVDSNGNDTLDSTEYASPTRTVQFIKPSEVTGVVTMTQALLGESTLSASLVLTPALNGAQVVANGANDLAVGFTRQGVAGTNYDPTATWDATNSEFDFSIATNSVAVSGSAPLNALTGVGFDTVGGNVIAGTYSATAYWYDAANKSATATMTVAAVVADDIKASVAATADVTPASNSDAGQNNGSASVVTIRKGATSVNVTAKVYDNTGALVGAGVPVTATFSSVSGTHKVNGTTAANSGTKTALTDANGVATFSVVSSTAANNNRVDLLIIAQGVTGTDNAKGAGFSLRWADATYEIFDLADGGTEFGGTHTVDRSFNKGGSHVFNFAVVDQWGQPIADGHRLRIAATGRTVGTSFATVTAGRASYTLTDGGITATTNGAVALDVTIEQASGANELVTVDEFVAGENGAFSVDILDEGNTVTLAADAASYAGVAADLVDDMAKIDLVAQDLRTSNVATPAPGAVVTVTGVVANSITADPREGAVVTISGDSAFLFQVGERYAFGSLTFVAENDGEFAVNVLSNKVVKDSVITVTSNGASKTTKVSFNAALATEGAMLVVDAPASATPGSTFKVTATLTDKYGNPVAVATAGDVAVTYTGPGIVFGNLPNTLDAKGQLSFAVLLGSNDSGTASVTVAYDQNSDNDFTGTTAPDVDIIVSKSVVVGASATPVAAFTKRVGDKIQIVSQGSAKVRFMLNGKRVASRSSLGTLNRAIDLVDGKNVIEIYVDGKRVLRRAATK
jgi:hypothetical protein